MEQTKKPALTDQEKSIVDKWCKHYDLHFWGERTRLATAIARLFDDTGIRATKFQLSKARKSACERWGKKEFNPRRESTAFAFNSRRWEQMIFWLKNHAGELESPLETQASVTARMRYAGVLCNKRSVVHAMSAAINFVPLDSPPAFTV